MAKLSKKQIDALQHPESIPWGKVACVVRAAIKCALAVLAAKKDPAAIIKAAETFVEDIQKCLA